MKRKVLEVKNLSVAINAFAGKVQAVRDISFDLYRGETLAIVGESGSGKSITAKSILGILPPNAKVESGSILYDNNDLLKFSESDYYNIRGSKISMVFQDPLSALNPIMKIGKQITEALVLNGNLRRKDAKAKAVELMSMVGINNPEERYHQYPFEFSGGMRQRIVIAIALASSAELLICDEPTTALDVRIQSHILELIKKLKSEKELSIIFITHDMGVVANMADRIAVMYAGKIVEIGTNDEIFYQPAHPYTWALLSSIPDMETEGELYSISGTPPNMLKPPPGDAFALRNEYALELDSEMEPPFFKLSDTHYAATWLLHPDAPKVEVPRILQERVQRHMSRRGVEEHEQR